MFLNFLLEVAVLQFYKTLLFTENRMGNLINSDKDGDSYFLGGRCKNLQPRLA